jgi:hypothetical protein
LAKSSKNLGKPVSIHGVSPAHLQRAAIIAVLSFVFFLAMVAIFSFRRQIGYFILASAFLVVEIFTLVGFFTSRRTVLEIFDNGLRYKKKQYLWDEVESVTPYTDGSGIEVFLKSADKITLPATLHELKPAQGVISSALDRRKAL